MGNLCTSEPKVALKIKSSFKKECVETLEKKDHKSRKTVPLHFESNQNPEKPWFGSLGSLTRMQ